MPQLLPMLMSTATAATAGAGAATATAVAKFSLTKFLMQSVASMALSAAAMALAPKPAVQSSGISTDNLKTGADVPRSFILGTYATSGHAIMPAYVYDIDKDDNKYLTMINGISDAPISEILEVFIDGKKVNLKQFLPGNPGYHFDDKLGMRITDEDQRGWIKFHLGNQTAVDPMLHELLGNYPKRPYTDDMKMTGVAYLIASFKHLNDDPKYTSVPDVRVTVRGMPLYDPRKDSTNGGSGTHRYGVQSTYEHTDNPVVMAYNLFRGIKMSATEVYGLNASAEALPNSYWFAAMNVCDQDGTEPAATEYWRDRKRYVAGVEVSVDTEPLDVIENLLTACGAVMAESGGKYLITVGPPRLPVAHITDGSIIYDATNEFIISEGLNNIFNGVTARYPSPLKGWETEVAAPLFNAAWESEDMGQRLLANIDYNTVFVARQVRRLMREAATDNRRQRRHTITLPRTYLGLNPTDSITWTSIANGYNSKVFEIVSTSVDPLSLSVLLELRERNPADYDFNAVSDGRVPSNPSSDTVYFAPIGVDGFTAVGVAIKDASGKPRRPAIRMNWNTEVSYNSFEYELRLTTAPTEIVGGVISTQKGEAYLASVLSQTDYQIRSKPTSTPGVTATWGAWLNVTTPSAFLTGDDFEGGVTGLFDDAGITAVRQIADRNVPGNFNEELAWSLADSALYVWNATEAKWEGLVDTKLNDILEETMIAIGLATIKVVSALPATGTAGQQVVFQGKLYRWNGTKWQTSIEALGTNGQLTSDQIESIEVAKLSGQIDGSKITNTAINAQHLAANSVTNLALAADAVESANIKTGAVLEAKLANNAVTVDKIANNAVNANKLVNGAVTELKIANNAVTADKILNGAIDFNKLANNAVTVDKIASDLNLFISSQGVSASADKQAAEAAAGIAVSARDAANGYANAAATSASAAGASANSAGQWAAAANTAKVAAETARGQANTFAGQATSSATNANSSATAAAASAGVAATARDAAVNSATAAANSASQASASANSAGQFASATNAHSIAANTNAGIAVAKAAEAVNSASQAANSAVEASRSSQLAAMAMSGGMFKNPTFNVWTGVFPADNRIMYSGPNGTATKTTGKYGNAIEFNITSAAGIGPYLDNINAQMTGPVNPPMVIVNAEIEPVSGTLTGYVMQCGWKRGDTSAWNWSLKAIGSMFNVANGIQNYEEVFERPSNLANVEIVDFCVRFFPSCTAGGGVAAINKTRLHRIDVKEVKANSFIDLQQKVKSTVDGIAEAAYVLKVGAGGASAGFEIVAASNPSGSASAIRMNADNIIANGTIISKHLQANSITTRELQANSVTAEILQSNSVTTRALAAGAVVANTIQSNVITSQHLTVGAVSAREIAAGAIVASKLAIADFTNLVPDDQIQDSSAWVTTTNGGWTHQTTTPLSSIRSVGDWIWTRANCARTETYAMTAGFFPVTPGDVLFLSGQMIRSGGTKMHVLCQILYYDKNDASISGGNVTFAKVNGTSNTNSDYKAEHIVPAGAMQARFSFYVYNTANTDATAIYFASPTVRIKNKGEMIVDGSITGVHVGANTISGNSIVAGSILGDRIAANTISGNNIIANSINANTAIIDGTITSALIKTGAIGADQIAAGSIVASKLAITDFTNLVPDDQIQDSSAWVTTTNGGWTHQTTTPLSNVRSVGDWLYISANNTTTGDSTCYTKGFFPVTPGDVLFVSTQMIRSGGTKMRVISQIVYHDKNDVVIMRDAFASVNGTANTTDDYKGELVVPAGAYQARFRFYVYKDDTDSNVYFASPTVRIKNKGEMIVDGTITGNKIVAETIHGGLIAASGVITKSAQMDDAVITNAKIKNAAIDSLKIANNALYVPYRYTRPDLYIDTQYYQANKRVIIDRNITDFEGGAFNVAFNAYIDALDADDNFAGFDLLIDGVVVQSVKAGIRTSGGAAIYIMPVSLSANGYGSSSVNIKVRAWSMRYDNHAVPKENYYLRDISLTVSGARR